MKFGFQAIYLIYEAHEDVLAITSKIKELEQIVISVSPILLEMNSFWVFKSDSFFAIVYQWAEKNESLFER